MATEKNKKDNEKQVKKSMKKSSDKNEHKCTCGTNGCCSNSADISSVDLGATIRDVPDATTPEKIILKDVENDALYEDLVKTLSLDDMLCLLKDYCSTSGKTFDDISTALSEEERHKNESLFLDMAEKVEDAIKIFMQNSTDSDEIKNMMIKEMFSKFNSLYLSSTLKNKIDAWKKAQKHTCKDIKDKINKCTEENKKDEPSVVLKSIEDIFPWMKDEAFVNTEDAVEDDELRDGVEADELKVIDLDFPLRQRYKGTDFVATVRGTTGNGYLDIEFNFSTETKNSYRVSTYCRSYKATAPASELFSDVLEALEDHLGN